VREGLPELREGLTGVREGLPNVREGLTGVREGLPNVREGLPNVREGLPMRRIGFFPRARTHTGDPETVIIAREVPVMRLSGVSVWRPSYFGAKG
jgi:hypothetical protein